jgi:hypothetical protein
VHENIDVEAARSLAVVIAEPDSTDIKRLTLPEAELTLNQIDRYPPRDFSANESQRNCCRVDELTRGTEEPVSDATVDSAVRWVSRPTSHSL